MKTKILGGCLMLVLCMILILAFVLVPFLVPWGTD